MTLPVDFSQLCGSEGLDVLVGSVSDDRERAFINFGLAKVYSLMNKSSGLVPLQPFDLRYLTQVMREMYADRTSLTEILVGDFTIFEWPEP